jgi:hypothetical protein
MSLCETCIKRSNDYELGISLKPDGAPNEFRTWMICELNIDGFPFKQECKDYADQATGDADSTREPRA